MCLDEEDRVWFMLHSGSRGPGNRIGTVYIELAKNDMLKLDKQVKVYHYISKLISYCYDVESKKNMCPMKVVKL